MLVAMESFNASHSTEGRVREFAGMRGRIRRDRVIEQQSTFAAGNIADIKRTLAKETTLADLYPIGSREPDIVKAFGYN